MSEAKRDKEAKHVEIWRSFHDLEITINLLENLLNKVSPQPPSDRPDSVEEAPPSLVEVLDTMPNKLGKLKERTKNIISSLDASLF